MTTDREDDLARALSVPRLPVRLVRRCVDLVELLAAAQAGSGHVALISDDRGREDCLDRAVVAALHAYGVAVVVLVNAAHAPGRHDQVRALGIDRVLPDDVPAAGLIAALAEARPGPDGIGDGSTAVPDQATGHVAAGYGHASVSSAAAGYPQSDDGYPDAGFDVTGLGESPLPDHPAEYGAAQTGTAQNGTAQYAAARTNAAMQRPDRGHLIAVWGAPGSPGRTTLAINLAVECAAKRAASSPLMQLGPDGSVRGPEVLLVDADTYAPSISQHLGLLDESSGLALAARAAGQGILDEHGLARVSPLVSDRLRVLTGIGRASRWPEAPSENLDAIWQVARRISDVIVVDCAAPIEHDEYLSYDTRAPQRNAATLSALAAADTVVIVGGADPVSMKRLVHALDDFQSHPAAVATRRFVVVNRARTSVTGPHSATVLTTALQRYAGVTPDLIIPDDCATLDAAVLAGRALGEVGPTTAVRRTIAQFAEILLTMIMAPAEHPRATARAGTHRGVPVGG